MQVQPVDDVETLRVWQRIEATCKVHDHVGLPADPLEDRLPLLDPCLPDSGERTLLRLGVLDGRPVGTVELNLPTLDNLTAASVNVHVLPTQRRRGIGRKLLDAALEETRALGRPRAFFEVASPYPSGVGLAEGVLRAAGARPVLKEVRRLLDLHAQDTTDPPAAPAGYRLVQWSERAPEEHVDAMAYLMHRMSIDAPLEDMDWEPEVWDADRYRKKEETAAARGRVGFATLALHEASGAAAGFTDMGYSRYLPEVAYQWETLVVTSHRGHGLGEVLKAHNHAQLRRESPVTRWVNTWNAESNTHMVAINERLGFRAVEYESGWQLDR